MKQIQEIRSDYTDDQNLTHIDVFFTDDDGEIGKTIAVVDLDTGKDIFFDNTFKFNQIVKEEIAMIKKQIVKKI